MTSYYPITYFSRSFPYFVEVDLKVLALPDEGMKEYVILADSYNRITATLLEIVGHLKALQDIDPTQAEHYSDMIDDRLHKAHINMMEWDITRRRILNKWLRDNRYPQH